MAEDAFSLDSLLEDLDAVVSPPTTRFVPHPPAKDRLSSHHNIISNPKTRFAVQPGSSQQNSPEYPDRTGQQSEIHRNFGGESKATSSFAVPGVVTPPDTDENSIDNLLNLINSPQPKLQKAATAPSTTYGPFSPADERHTSKSTIFQNTEMSFADRSKNFGAGAGGGDHFGPAARSQQQQQQQQQPQHVHPEDPRIAEGSSFSSPFDSPSSHGSASTGALSSARKTHPMLPFTREGSFPSGGNGNGALPSAIHPAQHGQSKYGASSSGAGTGSFAGLSSGLSAQLLPLEGSSSSGGVGRAQTSTAQGSLFGRSPAPAAQSGLQGIMSSNSGGSSGGGFGTGKEFGATDDGRDRFLPTSINVTSAVAGSSSSASSAAGSKARCARVVIAGSAVSRGRKASSFASCACNNLRCLQCNFKVHCFAGSAWDVSVDYMFLRNTVPNETKLAARLLQSAASCAYCCQCSFATEAGERELQPQGGTRGDPQWICAGH